MQIRAQDAAPAEPEAAKHSIVFLRMRFKADGTLELLETQARPGKLKNGSSDAHNHPLRCRVSSPSGAILWTGEVEDPSVRRIEWEDPAQPGRLLSKTTQLPEVEFMVRVPLSQKSQRVEFRRAPVASAPAAAPVSPSDSVNLSATAAQNGVEAGELVGRFDLTFP